jgi:hypothetical protein
MKSLLMNVCAIILIALLNNASWASPATDDLIRMARSGIDEEVLTAYINASPDTYDLSADDIMTLKDLGVASKVIKEALNHNFASDTSSKEPASGEASTAISSDVNNPTIESPQIPSATLAVAPDPADQNISFFYEALYPYGNWLNIDGAWCWQPNAATMSVDWAPYCRHGHWVSSDYGWLWNSDYSWGWAPFHYGRWFRHPEHGWCWVPDNEWGPAWVAWRWGDDYCGWAPLPPRARYDRRGGFYFGDTRAREDFEFNLTMDDYFFVSAGHLCDPHPWVNMVPSVRKEDVYRKTSYLRNSYGFENNHIINHGPAVTEIARAMNRPIRPLTIVADNLKPGQSIRRDLIKENRLVIYKPTLAAVAPKNPLVVRSLLEKRGAAVPQAKNGINEALIKRRSAATEQTMKDQQLKAENAHREELQLQKAAQGEADLKKRAALQAESQIRTMNARQADNRVNSMKRWKPSDESKPAIIPQSRVLPQTSGQNPQQVRTQVRAQVRSEARIEQQRQNAAEQMIRSRPVQHNEPGHLQDEHEKPQRK